MSKSSFRAAAMVFVLVSVFLFLVGLATGRWAANSSTLRSHENDCPTQVTVTKQETELIELRTELFECKSALIDAEVRAADRDHVSDRLDECLEQQVDRAVNIRRHR